MMRWPTWKRRKDEDTAPQSALDANAYVDGELSAEDLARFEALLATDPALAAEVASLRAIKSLSQAMPAALPRRSFALTPEMIAAAKPRPAPRVEPRSQPGFVAPLMVLARTATAAGVVGLSILAVTALDFSSSGSDDSAAGGTLASSESAALSAQDSAAVPKAANSTGDDGGSFSTTAGGANAATPAGTITVSASIPSPEPNRLATSVPPEGFATTLPPATGGERNNSPGQTEDLGYTIELQSAAPSKDDGPNWRLVLSLAMGALAIAGGATWIALSRRGA